MPGRGAGGASPQPLGRAAGPLHGRPPPAARPALDAYGPPAAGRGVPDLPEDAASRARPPPRLPIPEARRLVPHAGVLPARVEPVPPAGPGVLWSSPRGAPARPEDDRAVLEGERHGTRAAGGAEPGRPAAWPATWGSASPVRSGTRAAAAHPLLTRPDPDQVALEHRLGRVPEVGAAVRELAVVEVLDLAPLDPELHPELRPSPRPRAWPPARPGRARRAARRRARPPSRSAAR